MSASHFRKIPSIMGILDYLNDVKSILDIGAGFGKYGVILREHMDIRKGRLKPSSWKTTIDCVESSKPIVPGIYDIYNHLFEGPIETFLESNSVEKLPSYDLILLADMIEYLDKRVGAQVLKALFSEHCLQGIVLSYAPAKVRKFYPNQIMPVSVWEPQDFSTYPRVVFKGTQVVYLFK